MSTINVAVLGSAGRMGRTLVRAVHETPGIKLVAAVEQTESPAIGQDSGMLAGIGESSVPVTDDLEAAISIADTVIDFTAPVATVALAKLVAAHNCIHVIGTTGCTPQQDEEISKAAENATIVKSGNMSLGVNLLAVLVEQAANALSESDFDIEVLEMHHKHKVDAPSGTALLLGDAAAKGRKIDLEENSVRTRDGITGAREDGTIGFATLRGGAVVGDHSVIFSGSGECIELSHRALDRSLFATGAVRATLWAKDKPAGLYSMRDVLGL
ncbi:MAG: 4-hydroxy-tetrahydrodipicolinate reductase [Rhizobiaceae bacterium]